MAQDADLGMFQPVKTFRLGLALGVFLGYGALDESAVSLLRTAREKLSPSSRSTSRPL